LNVPDLEDSYRLACRLTRRTARNFWFSFLTLPHDLRRDMCVLYAYMRQTDDLGDDESISIAVRRSLLDEWRHTVREKLAARPEQMAREPVADGRIQGTAILPALADVVGRHAIPTQSLFDVIDGVRGDLEPRRFTTFGELEAYCHLVAGAVGICCIHIWGFDREQADALRKAVDVGTAFQLTNILRDLGEDLERGRLYLPTDDLNRFGLTEDSLRASRGTAPFQELMAFEAQRAWQYYDRGRELSSALTRRGRSILGAMYDLYGGLLRKIESNGYDVFSRRVRLSLPRKLLIVGKSMLPWSAR
jgi:phytoene synthase